MQVVCPKCKSRFNLPAGTMPGARLRCSVCKTVFSLPEEERKPAFERASDLGAGTLPPLEASDVPQSALPQLEEPKQHHPFLWFVVIVLVLGIAGYAAWQMSGDFRMAVTGLKNKIAPASQPTAPVQLPEKNTEMKEPATSVPTQPSANATAPAEAPAAPQPAKTEGTPQVSSEAAPVQSHESASASGALRFEKVRQYFVDNGKVGRILVIEGQVVGKEPFQASSVQVEAMIIGEDRNPLEKKVQKVGVSLSHFQLQVMDKDELESALSAETGEGTKKADCPFMVLFYNPAKTVSEFAVKIK